MMATVTVMQMTTNFLARSSQSPTIGGVAEAVATEICGLSCEMEVRCCCKAMAQHTLKQMPVLVGLVGIISKPRLHKHM